MLCAFLGVIFISVQEGLATAGEISIFKILLQITRPKTAKIRNLPGTDIYPYLHLQGSCEISGFLILCIEAHVNFANNTYLNERILRWIEEIEGEDDLKKHSSFQFDTRPLSCQCH